MSSVQQIRAPRTDRETPVFLVGPLASGAVCGAGAWSAYAVVEFIFSSLLFAAVRPQATFAAWHWRLTAGLVLAYLVTGAATGALAGAIIALLKRRTRVAENKDSGVLLEAAVTLTLVAAFFANLLAFPFSPSGKPFLVWLSVVIAALLVVCICFSDWNRKMGPLLSPWMVSILLLAAGQLFSGLEMQGVNQKLGVPVRSWLLLALCGLLILVFGAVILGRRWGRSGFPTLRWAATGAALFLSLGLAWPEEGITAQILPAPASGGPDGRPNVVILMMDTVRADHLSVYGYERETTPQLKRLALDSVLYTHALAPSDMTLSSHASLFTGMYPSWHGAHCQPPDAVYGQELQRDIPTLAEILASSGYSTMGVSANMYLRQDFGLQRGFEVFRIPRPVPILPDESWYLLRRGIRRVMSLIGDTSQLDRLYGRGGDIGRELRYLLAHRDGARPFFVFANYMDAHFPYIPPSPFDRKFPGKQRGLFREDIEKVHERVVQGQAMPESFHSHTVSQYDGGIAYIDAEIGRLVEWLKKSNTYDNTLIVICSDHGEAFGEKNLVMHANSAYQNLLHVPLLIKFPKSTRKGVVHDPVSLIDVMPTILQALGRPVPANVQGRNLLEASSPRSRELFAESFPCPALHTPPCPGGCLARAALSWPYKILRSGSGKFELYDVANDPGESRNLAASEASRAMELEMGLAQWVKTIPYRSSQINKLNGEALRRLKSLGYIQ